MLKFLHHLSLIIIIITLSLIEVSDSVRLCRAYSQTTSGETQEPFQTQNDLENSEVLQPGKDCKPNTNDCVKTKNFDKKTEFFGLMTKKALDRWLSGFVMFIISVVSIGAAYSCIGGVRSGMMNNACSWTAVPLAIGGLAYLVGEIGLYLKTKENLMGSFNYNQEDLDTWSEFCLKFNSYSSKNKAIAALNSGELEDLKPRHSDKLFNNENPQPFEVYCDQVAMVQRQKIAFESLQSGLEFKKNLTLTAISSFGLASVVELVQAIRQGLAEADDKSDLQNLLTCWKKNSVETKSKLKKLEGQINTDIVKLSSNPPIAQANTKTIALLEIDLVNAQKVKLLCIEPIQKCAETLEATYAFHVVYGKKKAVEGNSPVSGSDGLMCLKDYAEFTFNNDYSRQACYFALAGCENIKDSFEPGTQSPGSPGIPNAYHPMLVELARTASRECIKHFIKKEKSEGNYSKLTAGECSLGDVSKLKEDYDKEYKILKDEIKGKDQEIPNSIDTNSNLQDIVTKVEKSEQLNDQSKAAIQKNLEEMIKLQKSIEDLEKLKRAQSVEAIEKARDLLYQSRLAESRIEDACVQSCINGENKNPIDDKKKASYQNQPDNDEENFSPAEKEFYVNIEKMLAVIVANSTANENFEMNNTKLTHWWSAIPFALALIAVFFKVFSSFMRFYYQTPLSRIIWILVLIGLATWNLINLTNTIEELATFIGELGQMIEQTRVDLAVNVAGANLNAVNQTVNAGFEDNVADEFQDRNLGVKLPCAAGGDGKGGCKKVGTSLKATLKALEVNGLAGISNSMSDLENELSGSSSISSKALQSSSNLNNAIKKIDTVRQRLMKNLNEQRSKLGQAPFNPEPAAKRITAALKSAVINSKHPELKAALGEGALAKAKEVIDGEEKDLLKMLKDKKEGGVEETGKTEDFMSGLKFDFKSNEQPANSADFDMSEDMSKISNLNIPMDDITDSSSANIFKVISTRYFKSAYPKLLDEVE